MTWLGQQERTIFLGQGVAPHGGTSMSGTFAGVPIEKRIEMPVAEELQIGMSVGMSLNGFISISIIPRWNFALRAADQIINHMDRLPIYSAGGYRPKVIVRVAAPSNAPFYPQAQHDADFTEPFRMMLRATPIVALESAGDIVPAYQRALEADGSTILVEFTDRYRNKRGGA
jgi:pyruvate/2-oxoglutarate/acetoin dehydrogenase E1 component